MHFTHPYSVQIIQEELHTVTGREAPTGVKVVIGGRIYMIMLIEKRWVACPPIFESESLAVVASTTSFACQKAYENFECTLWEGLKSRFKLCT